MRAVDEMVVWGMRFGSGLFAFVGVVSAVLWFDQRTGAHLVVAGLGLAGGALLGWFAGRHPL